MTDTFKEVATFVEKEKQNEMIRVKAHNIE